MIFNLRFDSGSKRVNLIEWTEILHGWIPVNNSLKEKIQEIWTIARKELLHCMRDSHVIVYSVVLPIVFYPIVIIGASEFALWREGLVEKSPMKICIEQKSKKYVPELSKILKRQKKIKEVDCEHPMADLRKLKIDGYLVVNKNQLGITGYLNPSSDRHLETRVFLMSLIETAKGSATDKVLKKSGLPKKILKVYSIDLESLAELKEEKTPLKSPHKYAMFKSIFIGVLCVYTLVIIQSGTVYPALTSFTLEIEKKTKMTTHLLPVEPWHLIIGKFTSVFLISLGSAVINLLSLLIVVLYLVLKLPGGNKGISRLFNEISISSTDIVAVLSVFFLAVFFLSSVYCLVAANSKSFKEAQNIASCVLISTMLLPAVALIPGIGLNNLTVLVPLSNIVLAAKGIVTDEFSIHLVVIAVLVNILVSIVLLYLAKVTFCNLQPDLFKWRQKKVNPEEAS